MSPAPSGRLPEPTSRRPNRLLGLAALLLPSLIALASPGPAGAAAVDGIPDPLSLEQAMGFAASHPRVTLGGAAADLPRSPPLYLDCERLAFSQLEGDDSRARPSHALLTPEAAQRLEIMERFLDVLLADLSYARFNEAMAVAYIQYDRANTRRELGQYAEVLVAELETRYQDVLRKRAASEASQRLTRELLAQSMGRPGELPRELTPPALTLPPSELPELEAVVAEAADRPRPEPGLSADTPEQAEARERLLDMELRRQALELLLRLEILETGARYAQTESFMRDLKLDESRTLYEQEVKADLGYSMSRQTMARMQEAQVRSCRALAWAELSALRGGPVPPAPDREPQPETSP